MLGCKTITPFTRIEIMPTRTSLSTSPSSTIGAYGNFSSLEDSERINEETHLKVSQLSSKINTLAKTVKKHHVSVSKLQVSLTSTRAAIDSLEAEILMLPTVEEQKRFAEQQADLEMLKRLLRNYSEIKKNAFPPLSTHEQEQKQSRQAGSFQSTTFSRKTYTDTGTSTPASSPQKPKRLNFDEETPSGYSPSLDSENEIN